MSHDSSKMGSYLVGCLLTLPAILSGTDAKACTIAVVSGKATEDGRPLLWKNRDTDERDNLVQVFSEGKYRVMAVIDAGHSEATWMGMNEAGLCLANSLSLDLPGGNTEGRGNGRFMKLALQTCASVKEFEALLSGTNASGRRTRANFAVIDASGAAMIFEAGHRSFVKFDANDPKTAPQGYLVRANFSMSITGARHQDHPEEFLGLYSGRRYLRADGLVQSYLKHEGRLDYRFFLQNLSRDVAGTLDDPPSCLSFQGQPASTSENKRMGPLVSLPESINTHSTINRQNTVSAVVFHGVRPGDAPCWTTMWTLLGEPAFSVAVPCWITAKTPSATLAGKSRSLLGTVALKVRELNYDSPTLLNTRRLRQVWSQTLPVENRIIQQTAQRMNGWRKNDIAPTSEEMAGFQEAMARSALQSLLTVESLIINQPARAEKPRRPHLVASKPAAAETANMIGE